MEDDILSRALRIDDRLRAAALSNPLRRRVILSLVGSGRSLTELSHRVDIELKRLHYHVTALVQMGLVRVHEVVPRAGRSIKRYVAVADAFYVPDGLVPHPTGESLASELRHSLEERRRVSAMGTVYDVDARGNHRIRPLRKARAREIPWLERWQLVELSTAGARQLAEELGACVRRALAIGDDDPVRRYLVHLAVAPAAGPGRR